MINAQDCAREYGHTNADSSSVVKILSVNGRGCLEKATLRVKGCGETAFFELTEASGMVRENILSEYPDDWLFPELTAIVATHTFDGGYGRVGNIHVSVATCTICDTLTRCIAVDTSNGEYATAYICKRCADKLLT